MKIPFRVKIALKILSKYCEKHIWCRECPFYHHTKKNERSSCEFNYKNPYAIKYEYIKENKNGRRYKDIRRIN